MTACLINFGNTFEFGRDAAAQDSHMLFMEQFGQKHICMRGALFDVPTPLSNMQTCSTGFGRTLDLNAAQGLLARMFLFVLMSGKEHGTPRCTF
jgi:hypothetical protein